MLGKGEIDANEKEKRNTNGYAARLHGGKNDPFFTASGT